MKVYLYTVFDVLAGESGPIFEAKNDDIARRMFRRMMKDVENESEYGLYCLGVYDHENMCIHVHERIDVNKGA